MFNNLIRSIENETNEKPSPFEGGARRAGDVKLNLKMKNKIIPYNPKLKEFARKLRKEGIRSEIYLWKQIKNKSLGVEFHRQVPIDNYIVDFYCHELKLAIEIDGYTHKFPDVKRNDIIRQNKLESFGIRFLRFEDNDVVSNLDFVINDIIKKINELQNIPLNPPSKGEYSSPF